MKGYIALNPQSSLSELYRKIQDDNDNDDDNDGWSLSSSFPLLILPRLTTTIVVVMLTVGWVGGWET